MTRECYTLQELISAYADGECNAEEVAEVEAHLKDCAACRKELERLQANAAWVACSAEPFPEELHGRIMERVTVQKAPNKRRWISTRVLVTAVAACAVFCLAIGVYGRLGDANIPLLRNLRADSTAVGLSVSDQSALRTTQAYRMRLQGVGEWRGEQMREDVSSGSRLILSGERAIWIDEVGMERKGTVSYGDDEHPVRLFFDDVTYVIDYDGTDGITVRLED